MRLTAFSDVSLRVLVLLNGLPEGQKLTTQQLAEGVGSPYHHVTKTVANLAAMGLVLSARGRSGGVRISDQGRDASLGGLLRQLEGDQPMVECESPHGDCPLDRGCTLRGLLARAREAFYADLEPVRIRDLANPRQTGPVMVELGLAPPTSSFPVSQPQGEAP